MPIPKEKRWVEISVEAEREAVDDIVNLLGRHCVGGAVVEDKPGAAPVGESKSVTVKGFLPTWDEDTRRKLEVALLLLGKVSHISPPRITTLEPEDWAESWKAFFPPQHIGARTVIVPTWHEYAPVPGEVIIRLDPGMAFGTGLHASTRLCLIAVEKLVRPGQSRVLDVGTGSGILSIAAALQGAAMAQAMDLDAVAVEVARENVALNHVESIVQVERGTLEGTAPADVPRHTATGYDLLLVNILAEVIIGMAPAIAAAMAPGGQLACSGIIREKAEDVARALAAVGLILDERLEEEGWVALIAHKQQ